MEKIQNCPNNAFDCGVGCGLIIMSEAILEIMEHFKDDSERKRVLVEFKNVLHSNVHERHLEHMNTRYEWKKTLDKLIKH